MKAQRISMNPLRAAAALLFLVTGAAAVAPLAFGQQASTSLEEVVVTATRRTETNLQVTPISVTAVTAADIDRLVAPDISGIAAMVPGLKPP